MVAVLPVFVNGTLTLLFEQPVTLDISIESVKGAEMRIRSPRLVPLRTLARVSRGECLWLGEVIECRPDGTAVIEIAHALKDVENLARIADRFLGKAERYADSLCPTKR
jgi:hypothetical protein